MSVVAIVQARVGSTRLPGKVLMKLGERTVLEHVCLRLHSAKQVDEVVVATSTLVEDDRIVQHVAEIGCKLFRGDERDVLDRFYRAAVANSADYIVRVTSDCPLADPDLIDAVVRRLREEDADYASNNNPPSFPHGLDVEAFRFSALERAWREADDQYDREHVTPYIRRHTDLFRVVNLAAEVDRSLWRLTLDYPEDLKLMQAIFEIGPGKGGPRHLADIVYLLEAHTELLQINAKRAVRNQ